MLDVAIPPHNACMHALNVQRLGNTIAHYMSSSAQNVSEGLSRPKEVITCFAPVLFVGCGLSALADLAVARLTRLRVPYWPIS